MGLSKHFCAFIIIEKRRQPMSPSKKI